MGITLNCITPPAPPQLPHASAPSSVPLRERLRERLPAWLAAGASPQVLQWIREGARCEWLQDAPPPYDLGVSLRGISNEESSFFEKEYERLFASGAWEAAPPQSRSHVC